MRLAWTTASELNNQYFEVQHSLDGRTFQAIGQVAGHGNSVQASTYTYTDATPGAATMHYYRLRQVDTDGSSTFGPVQAVSLSAGSSAVQLSVAPNPTTPAELRVQLQYGGTAPTAAVLTVHSLLGAQVLTQPVTLQPGANVFTPNTMLPAGAYWVSVSGGAALGKQGTKVLLTN